MVCHLLASPLLLIRTVCEQVWLDSKTAKLFLFTYFSGMLYSSEWKQACKSWEKYKNWQQWQEWKIGSRIFTFSGAELFCPGIWVHSGVLSYFPISLAPFCLWEGSLLVPDDGNVHERERKKLHFLQNVFIILQTEPFPNFFLILLFLGVCL